MHVMHIYLIYVGNWHFSEISYITTNARHLQAVNVGNVGNSPI